MLDILADCSNTETHEIFSPLWFWANLFLCAHCTWNVQIVIRHEVLRFVNTVKATVPIWSNRCTIPLPNARLGCSPTIRTSIPSSGPPRTHHSPRASSSFIKWVDTSISNSTSQNVSIKTLTLISDRWTHSQAQLHPSTGRHVPAALPQRSLHCLPLPLRRWRVVISLCPTTTGTQGWSVRCPRENWFKRTRPRPDPVHSPNQCLHYRCRPETVNHLRRLTANWSPEN